MKDMFATVRLFKAVPIDERCKETRKFFPNIMAETIKRGFVFSNDVFFNYSEGQLEGIIEIVEQEVGLTPEQMNSSFHKSWAKVRDAPRLQLYLEQIMHYFTTYGFQALGVYSEDTVYIPNEKLEIPETGGGMKFVVIKGYTTDELKEKTLKMLRSGIALSVQTMDDLVILCNFTEISPVEIETIQNREVKIRLWDSLGIIPTNAVEFLRYMVYKTTEETMLIKNKKTIELIKESNYDTTHLFMSYGDGVGLEHLAEIFYRFKPLFLALKNEKNASIINQIRRLAVTNHKPMTPDYLNDVTMHIKNGHLSLRTLKDKLSKANIWRKIRLAYALKYRTKEDTDCIVYQVRNGRGYATDFSFDHPHQARSVLKIVTESIINDISPKVKGKTILIPENITYALPATEKKFVGDFPSGSFISVPGDMVVGVHWFNLPQHQIDLDLSTIDTLGKIGWNASYRRENARFSGDVVDAPRPKGASELFQYDAGTEALQIMNLNYYNHHEGVTVPFRILVAHETPKRFGLNYTVNPNNIISVIKSKITANEPQVVLGIVDVTKDYSRFYLSQTKVGKSNVSSDDKHTLQTRKYMIDFLRDTISLNDILKEAGANIVSESDDTIDIDLSPVLMEKDKIMNILQG